MVNLSDIERKKINKLKSTRTSLAISDKIVDVDGIITLESASCLHKRPDLKCGSSVG